LIFGIRFGKKKGEKGKRKRDPHDHPSPQERGGGREEMS